MGLAPVIGTSKNSRCAMGTEAAYGVGHWAPGRRAWYLPPRHPRSAASSHTIGFAWQASKLHSSAERAAQLSAPPQIGGGQPAALGFDRLVHKDLRAAVAEPNGGRAAYSLTPAGRAPAGGGS